MNFEAIEGVEDSAHNFYFVSPLLLGQGGQTTIGHGTFSNGSVTNVALVNGLLPKPAPSGSRGITFDLFITPDGNTLYFSDFMVKSGGAQFSVQGAQLAIATRNVDGTFTRLSNSADILKNVNALGSLVYNATPSADGLELAFNASSSFPIPSHIYIATRTSPSAPFGNPQLVAAADLDHGQLSEPGSFSPDGKYLYFHRVLGPSTSQIYVLTRQKTSVSHRVGKQLRISAGLRGCASIGFCKGSASSRLISCKLIGAIDRDSLPLSAGGRVIRCGPRNG
ncbi:MAG: hypothetical protein WCC90_01630 [Methylocella sp.]